MRNLHITVRSMSLLSIRWKKCNVYSISNDMVESCENWNE